MDIYAAARSYAAAHAEEAKELLRTLGKIPAPSHDEGRRATFILNWLKEAGAKGAYIDTAGNVLFPYCVQHGVPFGAVMAHTDIVQPDTEPLPMREEDGKLYAPGIGDDTANVVCLMMAVKFLLENEIKLSRGILFAANVCEEGLGNLKGSRQILADFPDLIDRFISLDCYTGGMVNKSVGSARYRIVYRAEGGHSYFEFGHKSAIAGMAAFIQDLYAVQVPAGAKTTYNVGTISGGSTVNSIAEHCEILYEYRSEDRRCLQFMGDTLDAIVARHVANGADITVETLGIRPCDGDVDEAAREKLTRGAQAAVAAVTGREPKASPGSTDANSPLSLGIPAVTFGTVEGALLHTRGEWIALDSLRPGVEIAIRGVLMLAELEF